MVKTLQLPLKPSLELPPNCLMLRAQGAQDCCDPHGIGAQGVGF